MLDRYSFPGESICFHQLLPRAHHLWKALNMISCSPDWRPPGICLILWMTLAHKWFFCKLSSLPTKNKWRLARVRATLMRRGHTVNPNSFDDRTQEIIMTSFSIPWNASTVLTWRPPRSVCTAVSSFNLLDCERSSFWISCSSSKFYTGPLFF